MADEPQTRHIDDPEGLEERPLPEWQDTPVTRPDEHHIDDPPEGEEPAR